MAHRKLRLLTFPFLPLVVLAIALVTLRSGDGPRAGSAGSESRDGRLSGEWWDRTQEAIIESEYHLSRPDRPARGGPNEPDRSGQTGERWQAPNRAHGFRTHFEPQAVRVVPRAPILDPWEMTMHWVAWGRQGAMLPIAPAQSREVEANRIEYRRGDLLEWYLNSPSGLEQGFVLEAPPIGRPAGASGTEAPVDAPLVLELELSGSLKPVVGSDGRAVDLLAPGGAQVLRYAELHAWDADGRELGSRLDARRVEGHDRIRLLIDDSQATYPIIIDPLMTFASWATEGNQAAADYGFSVATAGDVNGDGYFDVIVGAHFFDFGQFDEGRAYVYQGSASGLALSPVWTAEGNSDQEEFGFSVATAGDVNGDGLSDIIVGAPMFGVGQPNEGRAVLYLGTPSGPTATPSWTSEGNQTNAFYGFSVACAGDVNGDGFSDIVVGAREYADPEPQEGRAEVFYGSASGPSIVPDWSYESDQANTFLGNSVATAGDVNGDGFSDLLVGAFLFDNAAQDAGAVLIFHGSAAGLAPTAATQLEGGSTGELFGGSVSTAGDVNGDGYADVVVGAEFFSNGQAMEGAAFAFYGSSTGVSLTPNWTVESDQALAELGTSVATAGDVNGDGYADVIVGAHQRDNDQQDEGAAFVYLGSASGLSATADWSAEGNQTGAGFGISVATAGDVNGDGYADVIVGGNRYDLGQENEGRAVVFLGRAGGLSSSAGWSADGDSADAALGSALGSAGDVNGDGYPDLIVGAPGFDGGEAGEGRALLYFGSADGPSSTADWFAEGDQVDAAYGSSVAGAGDVDNDGFGDIIVGAPLFDAPDLDEGRATLYLGSPGGPSASADWTTEGDQPGAQFGASVASAGDVNGDGLGDVIVGAPLFDAGEPDEGRALVYLGSVGGLLASAAWTAESDQSGARFGHAVGTAGDVDGDEFSDVIVGANLFDGGQNDEGAVFVYAGSPLGPGASASWTIQGNQTEAQLGYSAGTAGDVDGDGFADVIVGAPLYDDDDSNEGRVTVHAGSASGLDLVPAWTAFGNQQDARYGHAVATAGDVNGDGFSDVVIGANLYDGAAVDEGLAEAYFGSSVGLSTTADWSVGGGAAGAELGYDVAGAGDLNGDAYAEVVVGAPGLAAGQPGEGGIFVHYGNERPGVSLVPQQRRGDNTGVVSPLGSSECADCFRVSALGRTPFGRGLITVEAETKLLGVPFDGSGISSSIEIDSGLTGTARFPLFSGLLEGGHYHWRVRIRYGGAQFPFQRVSRWFTAPVNGATESDIKTAGCRDEDGDGYGRFASPLCPQGAVADCDDTSFDCTTVCDDADGDGVALCAGDCDNTNPNCLTDCTDDDGDGFCVETDCDDASPLCTSDCTDDDGDGFCVTSDCDDANVNCTSDCTDDDGDGFCVETDCDEANPNCNSDCTDADADGYCVTTDCDEVNPNCASDCTDSDSDGFCVGFDCDDSVLNCTTDCTDLDEDGLSVCAGDCNDANPNCLLNCIDDDQDGFCIATDCDDTRPNCTTDCTDGDSDDFCITTDCDDDKPNCTVDCNDTDDDGYCQDLDCADTDADTFPGAAPNDDPAACMKDADEDDYGDDSPPPGVTPGTDCNDDAANSNSALSEVCNDTIDNDCDLLVDLADSDCSDLDVPTLQLVDHQTLIWDPALAADSYGLYRGRLNEGAFEDYNHLCEATQLTAPTAVDIDLPLPGEGFYYLVTGQRIDAGPAELFIEGSLGFATNGTPRPDSDSLRCGQRIFVDPDLAVSPGGGLSWATAYTAVGYAFRHRTFPERGLELWLRGTSTETFPATLNGSERRGARLLGGFAGVETLPWDRSPNDNPTAIQSTGGDLLRITEAAILLEGLTLRNGATGLHVTNAGEPVELERITAEQLTQYGLDLQLGESATTELRILSGRFDSNSLGGVRAVATRGSLLGRIRGNEFLGVTGTAIRLEARAGGGDATVALDVELNRIKGAVRAVVLGAHVNDQPFTARQVSFVASNLLLESLGDTVIVEAGGTFLTESGLAAARAEPLIVGNTISSGGNRGILSSANRIDVTADPSLHTVRATPEIWDNLITFVDGIAIDESADDPPTNLVSDPIVVGNDLFGNGSLYGNEGGSLLPTIADVNALTEANDNFDADPLYVDPSSDDYRLQLGTRTAVDPGAVATYRFNTSNPNIGLDWTQPGYDDLSWQVGPYGIGYDTNGAAAGLILTTIPFPDVFATASLYTRTRFSVDQASQVRNLLLGLDYDDGVVVWINGTEVYRSASMPPGPPQWNTAAALHESSNGLEPVFETVDITTVGAPLVVDGENVVAIGVWNAALPSTDLVVVPSLVINAGDDNIALDRGHLNVPRLAKKDFQGKGRASDGDADGVSLPDVGALER